MSSQTQFTQAEQEKLTVINDLLQGGVTNGQAATKLKLSLRQIKRLKKKIKEQGELAAIHQLKGRIGNHHISAEIKHQVLTAIKERYSDFKPKLATEKLVEYEGLTINPQTLRRWMTEQGLWKPGRYSQPEYHAWRERREYFGELQQFDGSYHHWFEDRLLDESGDSLEVCLLASIDDATGKIGKAVFAANEGIIAVFTFWKEYVSQTGKPVVIYLDKFSTYKINHKSAVDNFELMTQFQKCMKLLNIEIISANSPQAKGRVERLFGTLQDRLVKELRLKNISTILEGNKFLQEVFIPSFNNQFSVVAAKQGDVHRVLTKKETSNLKSIFSIKSTRKINQDFTIQFKNNFYQLREIQPVTIRPKEQVLIEEWLNGSTHFKFREHYLRCFILPERPKKIYRQPVILTNHPLNWKPPRDHPWRKFKYGRG